EMRNAVWAGSESRAAQGGYGPISPRFPSAPAGRPRQSCPALYNPSPLAIGLRSQIHRPPRDRSSPYRAGGGLMRSLRITLPLVLAVGVGCTSPSRDVSREAGGSRQTASRDRPSHVLKLISGSENEALFSALDENGKVRKDPSGSP